MNDKFYDQNKEKQDLMLNGAIEVIAKNGYKHASTDEMVAVSGVSKGLWFHYFGNKKGLYDFVVHYSVKYALLELDISIPEEGLDYFELWNSIAMVFIKLMDKYPYLPYLLVTIYDEKDDEIRALIQDTMFAYAQWIQTRLLKAADALNKRVDDVDSLNNIIMASLKELLREYYSEPLFRKESFLDEFKAQLKTISMLVFAQK